MKRTTSGTVERRTSGEGNFRKRTGEMTPSNSDALLARNLMATLKLVLRADPYVLRFDTTPTYALDDFALMATQQFNLGNPSDWFGTFRGGRNGMESKIYGLQQHYSQVHAWLPMLRHRSELDYHCSTILFLMDSALECFVFALNAL